MCLVFIFILCFNFVLSVPLVKTIYGEVEGFALEKINGKTANIFLGIPFARPPIGELRFEVKFLKIFEGFLETSRTRFMGRYFAD